MLTNTSQRILHNPVSQGGSLFGSELHFAELLLHHLLGLLERLHLPELPMSDRFLPHILQILVDQLVQNGKTIGVVLHSQAAVVDEQETLRLTPSRRLHSHQIHIIGRVAATRQQRVENGPVIESAYQSHASPTSPGCSR